MVAGQAVVEVVDPASLWIHVRLDQINAHGLAAGLPAQVLLRSRAGQALAGRVLRVEPLADSVTEERIAQVAFDATPAGVSLGASVGELAEVTLQLPQTTPTLVLPNASIQRIQGQTGVWRLEGGKPSFAAVRLGANSLVGQVQILDGLSADDTVVVYSQKALTEGARVQVVDALVKAKAAP